MKVFLLTFVIFGLAMIGLALGWLLNQRTLKGSCGGLSSIPGHEDAQCACSSPCEKRKKRMAAEQSEAEKDQEKTIHFLG